MLIDYLIKIFKVPGVTLFKVSFFEGFSYLLSFYEFTSYAL